MGRYIIEISNTEDKKVRRLYTKENKTILGAIISLFKTLIRYRCLKFYTTPSVFNHLPDKPDLCRISDPNLTGVMQALVCSSGEDKWMHNIKPLGTPIK